MPKKFRRFIVLGLLSIALFITFHKITNPPQAPEISLCPLVETNFPITTLVGNSQRGEIYLNGTWQFLPELGEQKTPPPATADWGEILVPGDWQQKTDPSTAGVEKLGTGSIWQNYQGEKLGLAWYHRRVTIPPKWDGRSILLDLSRISTDAVVYLNNTKCGNIPWAGGMVDITNMVTPGVEVNLHILVKAMNSDRAQQVVLGPNEVKNSIAKLDTKGLIGDVRLLSMPKSGQINDVFIQTSTRNKNIKLDIELAGISQTSTVNLIAKMLDETGKVEQEFISKISVSRAEKQVISTSWDWKNPRLWDVGQGNLYTLKLSVQGAGIQDEYDQSFGFREFWIEGRKFYLNGKELRLRPTLYEDQWQGWAVGMPKVIETLVTSYAKSGFNIAQVWPWNHDIRGRKHFQNLVASIADRQGFPLIFPALDMTDYTDTKSWRNENTWQKKKGEWEQKMVRELRGDRNHPSILLWGTSPNYFGHGDDQNPLRIGKKQLVGSVPKNWRGQTWPEAAQVGEEAVTLIKKHDPTRPVLVHQGASVGDVYALNSYLNMLPLQEREDWLSNWSKTGNQPYMVVEFGTPLHTTMMRSRNGFVDAFHSEPWMTEFAAIYLGQEAYQLESKNYRDRIKSQFIKGREYKNWQGNEDLDFAPAFQKLQKLFSTNTWRSWRTYGITGGMLPWNEGHGWQLTAVGKKVEEGGEIGGTGRYREVKEVKEVQGSKEGKGEKIDKNSLPPFLRGVGGDSRGVFMPRIARKFREPWQPPSYKTQPGGQAILDNNAPTLAWIAGAKGDSTNSGFTTGFTTKDHNFWSGEKLQKQVVLINDTREEQPFSFTWQIMVNNQAIATGKSTGKISPAQTQFFPFEMQLPKTNSKQEGEINLKAQIGTSSHQDRFSFRIFPQQNSSNSSNSSSSPNFSTSQQIAFQVFDPVGKTTAMLQQLGYKTTPWPSTFSGTPLEKGGKGGSSLVIIGREALAPDQPLPKNLQDYVKAGGRAIAFSQKPEWYTNHNFRISPHLSRRIFPVDAQHPVTQGLDQIDLRDWRGESTLTEAYPDTVKNPLKLSSHNSPWYGWHWGNGGAVSSVPLEKPHRSGWRSILQSEFDLAYSPLMELDYGQGRLILSTLDLEDHFAQDPAANQLARQVINYAATAPLAPRNSPVVLVGNEGDTVLLEVLGVNYERAASLDKLSPSAELQIIGDRAKIPETELQNYLEKGGKVLFLPPYPAKNTAKATSLSNLPILKGTSSNPPLFKEGWGGSSLGIELQWQENFPGSLQIPTWAETRGLGIADLHARTDYGSWVISSGNNLIDNFRSEVGANGLLSRVQKGTGVAIATTLNPDSLFDPEDLPDQEKNYLRFTRWRQTRAIAQILANLGATFTRDELIWQSSSSRFWEKSWEQLQEKLLGKPPDPGFYHPDYWQEFNFGDDPYRYYRW